MFEKDFNMRNDIKVLKRDIKELMNVMKNVEFSIN